MIHDEKEQQLTNTVKMYFGKVLSKTANAALERNKLTLNEILQYWQVYTLELTAEIKRLKAENSRLTAESESLKQTDLFQA